MLAGDQVSVFLGADALLLPRLLEYDGVQVFLWWCFGVGGPQELAVVDVELRESR